MLEGEASYYQALYTKNISPGLLIESNHRLKNRISSKDYNIFLEFYQDMRDLLGLEMLDKWKSVSKEEDFMKEIEKYMQEHYQCSLGPFYQTWCAILYHYMSQYHKYYKTLELCKIDHDSMIGTFHFSYELAKKDETYYPKRRKELEEEISDCEMVLLSQQKLEQSMDKAVKKQKEELREYIEEKGEDDVSKEWEEEIKTMNLETYKEVVLECKTIYENEYRNLLIYQQEAKQKKQELDYQKNFLIDPSLDSFSIEELETLKNQQFLYFMQIKKQLESETLESSSNKQM